MSNQDCDSIVSWSKIVWLKKQYHQFFDLEKLNMEAFFERQRKPKYFKHDRTTTVILVNIDQQSFVVKRYNARNRWHNIKRAFRCSRARRCWLMSQAFERAGLKTAKSVMMFEKRWGLVNRDAYFVNKYVNGKTVLECLPIMPEKQQKQVKEAVYEAFRKMRQHRISHGDMKASNLLWLNGELIFIDLDAAKKHWLTITWKIAHSKDVSRFLKNWQTDHHITKMYHDIDTHLL